MERKTINFLVSDLHASQSAYYLTRNINEYTKKDPFLEFMVFFENLSKPVITPNFAIMQIAEAWGQRGVTIATTLSTASRLIHFPAPSDKIFYIWDLEWMRPINKVYDMYAGIYLHPSLKLIARSKDHAMQIKNCFNRDVDAIISDFDMEQILEVSNYGNK